MLLCFGTASHSKSFAGIGSSQLVFEWAWPMNKLVCSCVSVGVVQRPKIRAKLDFLASEDDDRTTHSRGEVAATCWGDCNLRDRL